MPLYKALFILTSPPAFSHPKEGGRERERERERESPK